jgi:hypothetical protein
MALSDYTPAEQEAIAQVWRDGDLTYLLHPGQQKLYDLIRAQQQGVRDGDPEAGRKYAINIARRWGKSWLLLTMALEDGLSINRGLIRYAASTDDQVTEIVTQILPELLEDCPDDIKPVWKASEGTWSFPSTGAVLKLSGMHTRNACNAQRGTKAHRCYVDEAAFSEHMEYLIGSVLMPQCLTTNGTVIISSTPPESPAHPFVALCLNLEARGKYHRRNIHDPDAPHLTPTVIEEFKRECGNGDPVVGERSTQWRREYLCEFVVDSQKAVVPEFTEMESKIVEARERPAHTDLYVIADLGYEDLSAWLFIHTDFKSGLWIVEDELVMRNASVTEQVEAARAKELTLWGAKPANDNGATQIANDNAMASPVTQSVTPYCRLADASPLVVAEMHRAQKYAMGQVDNSDREAAVNALRRVTQLARYRIHPRCKQTIAHMKAALWNDQRTSFKRMGSFGHFDCVAALMYAERHIDRQRNPWPLLDDGVTRSSHWIPALHNQQKPALASLGSKWRKPR